MWSEFFIIFAISGICNAFFAFPINAKTILANFLESIKSDDKLGVDDLLKYSINGHQCNRECRVNDQKICYFHFTMKFYQILGGACGNCSSGSVSSCFSENCILADGISRGFLSINFEFPAPAIHVCRGDIIVVDLRNDAEGLSTSLHWHGQRQVGTQFMDGVPYLTQCPIAYGTRFRYSFYANDEGTHFYHSHSGHQKANGIYGAMIVRAPSISNPNRHLYDYDLSDHYIIASDWMHEMAENFLPGYMKRSLLSQSMLINGHGNFYDIDEHSYTFSPLSIFNVQHGKKYRFRLINSAFNVCPFEFQIEKHNFTVIATELSYVKPVIADTLQYLSGERFDIVIDASQPIADYWIRIRELSPCSKRIEALAVLRYHEGDAMNQEIVAFVDKKPPNYDDIYPKNHVLNSQTPKVADIPLTHLKAYEFDKTLLEEPDKSQILFFDSPSIPNQIIYTNENINRFIFTTSSSADEFSNVGSVNNITFHYPEFPLLLEPNAVKEFMFCDENTINYDECLTVNGSSMCPCIHRIKFDLNSNVELILVNMKDKISHPIHLHGNKFHVIDMGILNETMTYDEIRNGGIPMDIHREPVYKDTVIMPFPGYVRLRFRASNPGYWLLHCHYDWHLPIGMALIIQIGEITEMPKPPNNFPKCHDYLPAGIV